MPSPMAPYAALGAGKARGQRMNEAERQEGIKRKLEAARIRLQAQANQIAEEARESQERRLRHENRLDRFMEAKNFKAGQAERKRVERGRKRAHELAEKREERLAGEAEGREERAGERFEMEKKDFEREEGLAPHRAKIRDLNLDAAKLNLETARGRATKAKAERVAKASAGQIGKAALGTLAAAPADISMKEIDDWVAREARPKLADKGAAGTRQMEKIERAVELKKRRISLQAEGGIKGLHASPRINRHTLRKLKEVILDGPADQFYITDQKSGREIAVPARVMWSHEATKMLTIIHADNGPEAARSAARDVGALAEFELVDRAEKEGAREDLKDEMVMRNQLDTYIKGFNKRVTEGGRQYAIEWWVRQPFVAHMPPPPEGAKREPGPLGTLGRAIARKEQLSSRAGAPAATEYEKQHRRKGGNRAGEYHYRM